MILVKVELHSAITGNVTELARMSICNTGDSENPNRGDYSVVTFKGRDNETLTKNMLRYFRSRSAPEAHKGVSKSAKVINHARKAEHVWNLVAKALTSMDYGSRAK